MPYSDRVLYFVRLGKSSSRSGGFFPLFYWQCKGEFQLPKSSPNPVDIWLTLDFTHCSPLSAPFHHQSSAEDLNLYNHSRKGSEQILSSLRCYTLNSLVNLGTNEARFPTSLNLQFCEVLITVVHFLSLICNVHHSIELQMKLLKGAVFATEKKRKKANYELLSLFLKSKSVVTRDRHPKHHTRCIAEIT